VNIPASPVSSTQVGGLSATDSRLERVRERVVFSPLWTVRVKVKNNGRDPRTESPHDARGYPCYDPDPSCFYGRSARGQFFRGSDAYTFDLTGHPEGSFNAWFDVSYDDVCGVRTT